MDNVAPPPAEDPDDPFGPLLYHLKQLWARIPKAIAFVPAALYFWIYWPLKERSLRVLRVGALSILFIQFVVLVAEVVFEIVGADSITGAIRHIKGPYGVRLQITSALVALFIVVYTMREFRQRQFEQRFADSLWRLLNERTDLSSVDEYFVRTLPLVHQAFMDCGVERVSFWTPTSDGLRILANRSWPRDKPPAFTFLPTNHGVASFVMKDQQIRYVPRLSFPFNGGRLARFCWHFPHALSFQEYTAPKARGPATGIGKPDRVDRPRLHVKQVEIEPDWWKQSLRAFVVAPARTRSGKCLGAISIDFTRTNPLGGNELKTALSLAILMAEELQHAPESQQA